MMGITNTACLMSKSLKSLSLLRSTCAVLQILFLVYLASPDHLFLDSAYSLGPLISYWEIDKFENISYKSDRILEVLKLSSFCFCKFWICQVPREIWVVQYWGLCPIIGDCGVRTDAWSTRKATMTDEQDQFAEDNAGNVISYDMILVNQQLFWPGQWTPRGTNY